MATRIYDVLALLGEDGILWFVSALLVVFFIFGYRKPAFRPTAPALMTSLGILGTFCGIFIALYEFDASPGEVNQTDRT